MKNKNVIIHIVQILIITIFMISLVPKEFQNDTFFTIALGERTVKYGIEEIDHLVWHENLKFIHLRWLFDVIIYNIFNLWNYCGIYIFVMIIATLQGLIYYGILNKVTKNKYLSLIFTLIIMKITSNEFTGRAQIMSFTLFLIEFYSIEQLIETNKKRYFIYLLLIPILLVNLHASVFPIYFILYLPYIAEFILSKLHLKNNDTSKIVINKIENKKFIYLLIIMCLSFLCGVFSPIGINSFKYMFKVMDGVSSDFINELQHVDLINNLYILLLIIIPFAIIAFTKVKVRLTDCLYIVGFLLLALQAYRCMFFFYLISTISIIRIIITFLQEYNINLNFLDVKLKVILYTIFLIWIILESVNLLLNNFQDEYVNIKDYPVSATNYILNSVDLSKMKIYNHFNFGSYLELNGIKAFIDSRSEMYTQEFNKDTTILNDWLSIKSGIQNYNEVFEKYDITHALLYNSEVINQYICNDSKWKLIYQDDSFSLYEKNE